MRKSYKIAACGMCTALSVVLMLLGGVLYFFSYTTPLLLGIIMLMVNKTFGRPAAVTTYFASSVLSMLLVTDKESVLLYVLFFGYYPIIKNKIDLLKFKPLRIFLKFILFNASLSVAELISYYVFGIPFFEDGSKSVWIVLAFTTAMNVIFVMFEFLLNKYYVLYTSKLEPKIKKLIK